MGTISNDVAATTNVTMTTTNETVVATISGITTGRARDIAIQGFAQITTGGGTTALTPRIRRGTTIAGTLVGEGNPLQVAAAAGSTEDVEISVVDTGQDVQGQSYVLTVQQTGAAADGTSLQATLSAHWSD